jgi:hypothetical protein
MRGTRTLHSTPALLVAAGSLVLAGLGSGCSGPEAEATQAGLPAVPDLPASVSTDQRETLHEALLQIRSATERFRDVKVAEEEGYLRDPMDMCVTAPMEGMPAQLGGMGVHYFRPDLLGITATEPRVAGVGTHTDFAEPGVLIYEPQADGSLELVAVENLVFADAWHGAGHTVPPSFHGFEYYRMVNNPDTPDVDEAHFFEPHYELHLWLYRENPTGIFMPFNPAVTCDHHRGAPLH